MDQYTWISDISLELDFRLDILAAIFSIIILLIGSGVLFYSYSYFEDNSPKLGLISSQLILFCGVMFGLVISNNLFLMYCFWEATTILSYFLIGHNSDQIESRRSANRALFITLSGGLAMLVGIIMLAEICGTYSISEMLAVAPVVFENPSYFVYIAIALITIGAFSKSALFPFQFWLPGAMTAPTPVSAYLHSAAMVKAGAYLMLRMSSLIQNITAFTITVCIFGGITMMLGGWRSLREKDLKLILAYGTVSQLGLILALCSIPNQVAFTAAISMIIAHALFKSTLFMSVGIIDHSFGTRQIGSLTGVGKKMPFVATAMIISGISMMGIPPTFGFIAKEAALEAFTTIPSLFNIVFFVVFSLGSVLTVAYTARFLISALADKNAPPLNNYIPKISEKTNFHKPSISFQLVPLVLSFITILLGLIPFIFQNLLDKYVPTFFTEYSIEHSESTLKLWHGFTIYLATSVIIVVFGIVFLGIFLTKILPRNYRPSLGDANNLYENMVHLADKTSVILTNFYQRGSLSYSIGLILTVFITLPSTFLIIGAKSKPTFYFYDHFVQPIISVLIIIAIFLAVILKNRISSVLLIGLSGYGLAVLFAIHGAPDLALTQVIVETITLICFVLVFRKLPLYEGKGLFNFFQFSKDNVRRIIIACGVGVSVFLIGAFSRAARNSKDSGISQFIHEKAKDLGYGNNSVNVLLVDIRSWDTLGEIAVLLVAATGIASLIFINQRNVSRLKISSNDVDSYLTEISKSANKPETVWLKGNIKRSINQRSIILETLTRSIFPSMVVLSIYLFFAGHNSPGGGFAGGLVLGIALFLRYLAGGKYEIAEIIPFSAGIILGIGLLTTLVTGLVPILFGNPVFTSGEVHFHMPIFGEVHLVSATFFDAGVFLIVVGLVLDIIRSLGVQLEKPSASVEMTINRPMSTLMKKEK